MSSENKEDKNVCARATSIKEIEEQVIKRTGGRSVKKVLDYVVKVMKDLVFQKDPYAWLENWKEERGPEEILRVPEDWGYDVLRHFYPESSSKRTKVGIDKKLYDSYPSSQKKLSEWKTCFNSLRGAVKQMGGIEVAKKFLKQLEEYINKSTIAGSAVKPTSALTNTDDVFEFLNEVVTNLPPEGTIYPPDTIDDSDNEE